MSGSDLEGFRDTAPNSQLLSPGRLERFHLVWPPLSQSWKILIPLILPTIDVIAFLTPNFRPLKSDSWRLPLRIQLVGFIALTGLVCWPWLKIAILRLRRYAEAASLATDLYSQLSVMRGEIEELSRKMKSSNRNSSKRLGEIAVMADKITAQKNELAAFSDQADASRRIISQMFVLLGEQPRFRFLSLVAKADPAIAIFRSSPEQISPRSGSLILILNEETLEMLGLMEVVQYECAPENFAAIPIAIFNKAWIQTIEMQAQAHQKIESNVIGMSLLSMEKSK